MGARRDGRSKADEGKETYTLVEALVMELNVGRRCDPVGKVGHTPVRGKLQSSCTLVYAQYERGGSTDTTRGATSWT